MALIFLYAGVVLLAGLQQHAYNDTAAYAAIRDFAPDSRLWGLIYTISGAGLLYALNFGRFVYVQIFAGLIFCITALWSVGFLLTLLLGITNSFFAWVIYAGYAFWALDILSDPLVLGPGEGDAVR